MDEFDTVAGHTIAGNLIPRNRATIADLELAATWCEQYEGEASDETAVALATAAQWLRREVEKRERRIAGPVIS